MARKLTTRVYVDGTWYGPSDRVPDDVAAMITNPKVWEGDPPAPVPDAPDVSQQAEEPPRGGPGSSAAAWRVFMEGQGFEVPEGASARDMQSSWDDRK